MNAACDHCLAPSRSIDAPVYGGKYGRLFPDLQPLELDAETLLALGREGGLCDGSPLAADDGADDARGAAGWPFFGQFVAHDITADRSPVQLHAEIEELRNFRTPRANLESVYGAGPVGSPFLYDLDDPAKLLTDRHDVPRNLQGVALVGDPRNDVHVFIAQLHLAFLRLHNLVVDRLREDCVGEDELFEEARRATTWHYQWVIVEDFLPRVVGSELQRELASEGSRWFRPDGEAFIPLEFADAGYRYGHSQIRHSYRLNDRSGALPVLPDLVGFRPIEPENAIDWSYLFDLPDRPAQQPAKRIDGRLPASLIRLPTAISGDVETDLHSLAVRDLDRGLAVGLPSGEVVAELFGEEPVDTGLNGSGTPLWLYVLRESDALAEGERLGPVGSRIVGEVLLGLIDADPGSYRAVDPSWRPTLPGDGDLGALLALTQEETS